MSTVTADKVAAYVSSFPPIDSSLVPVLIGITGAAGDSPTPTTTPAAAVAGPSLMAFTAEVDAVHAAALLNVTGFCQLQVSAGNPGRGVPPIDSNTDPVGYYTAVVNMLTNICFTSQQGAWSAYDLQTETVQLDQVVIQILANILSGETLTLAEAALNALNLDSKESGAPWTIFSHQSKGSSSNTFSFGVANETNGQVAISMDGFSMKGTEDTTRFLWATYSSSSLSIQSGSSQLVFNDALWNDPRIGAAISKAMAAHSANYIDTLPPLP